MVPNIASELSRPGWTCYARSATAKPTVPWLELGAAVNAGVAYVGNVGTAVMDFTALGDTVNVAARMQQHAVAGQFLVASGVADDLMADAPRRRLDLRVREQPLDAFLLAH